MILFGHVFGGAMDIERHFVTLQILVSFTGKCIIDGKSGEVSWLQDFLQGGSYDRFDHRI